MTSTGGSSFLQSHAQLHFDFEWQNPGGARGEELRATWASLAIRIDDTPITELLDRRTRSVRTQVYLPLYPLAEWLATNWWFLKAETEHPQDTDRDFDRRHNLRWAREGFALPSLRIVTFGSHFELQWDRLDIPDAGIQFLASGQSWLSAPELDHSLRNFVNAVVTRLDDMGVARTTLHDEWEAVQNANREEQEFCHASARLGVDPYSTNDSLESEIVKVAATVRPELLDDLLALTTIANLQSNAANLNDAARRIATDVDNVDAFADVRKRLSPIENNGNPWETGYRFASTSRAILGGGDWKSHSVEDLAGYLGIDHLERCLLPDFDECKVIDALVGTNQHGNPKILIQKKRSDSRQFAFCRAIFEHLTLPSGVFAAVSKLRTERQQMSRAFAAEFLAPHQRLKNDLSGALVYGDEVDDLADAYGVSAFVIRHQIENHRLARVTP